MIEFLHLLEWCSTASTVGFMDDSQELLEELRQIKYELKQLREDTGGINKKFGQLPWLLLIMVIVLSSLGQ